jgi:hypothetical protein
VSLDLTQAQTPIEKLQSFLIKVTAVDKEDALSWRALPQGDKGGGEFSIGQSVHDCPFLPARSLIDVSL